MHGDGERLPRRLGKTGWGRAQHAKTQNDGQTAPHGNPPRYPCPS